MKNKTSSSKLHSALTQSNPLRLTGPSSSLVVWECVRAQFNNVTLRSLNVKMFCCLNDITSSYGSMSLH